MSQLSSLTIDDNGKKLSYIDSGAPDATNGGSVYTTIIAVHGIEFTSRPSFIVRYGVRGSDVFVQASSTGFQLLRLQLAYDSWPSIAESIGDPSPSRMRRRLL